MSSLPEHVEENRRYWNGMADQWVAAGERSWASDQPYWGIWHLPEAELRLLPEDMSGMRAIELGCGTGCVSSWMARRGAEVVGIDISGEQLATARRLAAQHGVALTFLEGSAEGVLEPDATFDFAISEYGAAIWCDPHVWVREAARLLKSGGRLVFLGSHPLAAVCASADGESVDERLHRPWFDLHRLDWRDSAIDPGGIEFNLPFSAWLGLFADAGFGVEGYLELQAPPDAEGQKFMAPASWAKQFPSEQVWKLRRL